MTDLESRLENRRRPVHHLKWRQQVMMFSCCPCCGVLHRPEKVVVQPKLHSTKTSGEKRLVRNKRISRKLYNWPTFQLQRAWLIHKNLQTAKELREITE